MNKTFNPVKAYIPLYGWVYAIENIDALYETRFHFITSSIVNVYTTIFAMGIVTLITG
jgi:hypothetical protein